MGINSGFKGLIQLLVQSVLVAARYAGQFLIDLHTGRPLTQSDYTRSCIHTIVLLRMST